MSARITTSCLSLAVAVALTAAAHAEPVHNDELSIGGAARALRSTSANALTGDNLAGTSFGYARSLDTTVSGLALWADAGATISSASGTMFHTMSTDIAALELAGGLRARYPLHRLIAASARLDLGAQRVRVEISDSGTEASDHGWGAIASAGGALEAFVVRPLIGFGVRVELGYVAAQSISLTPRLRVPSDVLLLPMTQAALGRLDLGGPTFAVSLFAQF